jgi:hypothetical protein
MKLNFLSFQRSATYTKVSDVFQLPKPVRWLSKLVNSMQQTHSTFHTISGQCHLEMDCQSWSTAPALRYLGTQCNPAWLNPFTRPKCATTLACWFMQHKFWSWHSALLMWVLWICSHFWRERCHYGRDSCSWTALGMRRVETCLLKYEWFQIWGANLGLWTICTQVLFLPFWFDTRIQ